LFRDPKTGVGLLEEFKFEKAQSYQLDSIKKGYGSDGKMEYYNYEQSFSLYFKYKCLLLIPYAADFIFKGGIGTGLIFKNLYGLVFINTFAVGKNEWVNESHFSYQAGAKVSDKMAIVYDYYTIYYSDFEKGSYGPETIFHEISDMHKVSLVYAPVAEIGFVPFILYSKNHGRLGGGMSLNF